MKPSLLMMKPVPAARVTELFRQAYATPPEVVARIRKLFQQGQ